MGQMAKDNKSLGIPPQLSKAFNRAMKIGPNISMSKGKVPTTLSSDVMPGLSTSKSGIPQMKMHVPGRQQPKGISIKGTTKRIF